MTPPSPSLFDVGDLIAGKYRVERILGQGAMGMVVAAMHVELHELRAIKFMLPTALGDAEGVERFLREARACAKLKTKHVATVYDVGRLDNGAPYIVMEYLEGSDLKDFLNQERVLPVHVAVEYILQALEALGEAHQANIVHRDLKPANMFITAGVGGGPCIKIFDFGIAKLTPAGAGPERNEMTTTEMIMGSPLYMSPEQMKSSRYVDGRSDLWAIGVILYRMVTGVLPFNAATQPELFAMVLKDDAPDPLVFNANLPPGFVAIIMKCLEKDLEKRFKNAGELASALRPYLNPHPNPQEIDATTQVWRSSAPSTPGARLSDSGGTLRQSTSSRSFEPVAASTHVMAHSNKVVDSQPGLHWGPAEIRASYPSGPGGQTATAMAETVAPAPVANRSPALTIAIAVVGMFSVAGILILVLTSRDNAPPAAVATPPSVATPAHSIALDVASAQPTAATSALAQPSAGQAITGAPTTTISTGTAGQTKTGPLTTKAGSTRTGSTSTATNTTKRPDWGRDRDP